MPLFICPIDKKRTQRLLNLALLIGIISFFAAIIIFIWKGFYSRYWADDYCFSAIVKEKGIINGLGFFYQEISNRFGAFLLVGVSEFFGFYAIVFMPVFFMLITCILTYWNISLFWKNLGFNHHFFSELYLTLASIFFLLYLAPNFFQSFIWRSGLVSYFSPITFLLFLILILQLGSKIRYPWLYWIVLPIVAFIATGTSESYAALQACFFSLVLLYELIFNKKLLKNQEVLFLVIIILFTLLGMFFMVKTPGNQLRLDVLEQSKSIFEVISLSTRNAFDFIYYSIKGLPLPFIVFFFSVFILSYHLSGVNPVKVHNRNIYLQLLAIFLITYILITAIAAPTAFGMRAYPEDRVWILGRFVMITALLIIGILTGIISHQILDKIVDTCLFSIIIFAFLAIYPIRVAFLELDSLRDYREQAKNWDRRHQLIVEMSQKGEEHIVVNALDSISEVYEITDDAAHWVNRCAADFYGIKSIIALE